MKTGRATLFCLTIPVAASKCRARKACAQPTGLATEKKEKRRAELIEAIRNGSVATWKHFNLHGEFDFSDERMVDSMGLSVPKNPDWKSD